jgi:hypothetical protein
VGKRASTSTYGVQQFLEAVEEMPSLLAALLAAPSLRVADHPKISATPGIYLFSARRRPIYVGQSRKLPMRLRQHTGELRRESEASFTFNLAKREAAKAGMTFPRGRATLQLDPTVIPYFVSAKASVAAMRVQFSELPDPILRTLFEVYVALALGLDEFTPGRRTKRRPPPPPLGRAKTLICWAIWPRQPVLGSLAPGSDRTLD